jgi:multidrug resistance efflux pump
MTTMVSSRGKFLRVSVAVLLILAVFGAVALYWGSQHKANAGTKEKEGGDSESVEIPVKTVHPHYDKTFTMTERRPADVQAYYRADLETRVPGLVSMIQTDAGDVVKMGEVLVEVDVPDLKARVEQRTAAWNLAKAQVQQKDAALVSARAYLEVVTAKIDAAKANLKRDEAYLTFRKAQFKRFQELLESRSIDARLVDEEQDRREAALQAVNAATEKVRETVAEEKEARAKINQALADLEAANQQVKVNKADIDFAKSMLDYATVRAPFDGVIVRRNVDPGFFVQNAGNGHATPLLTIQRNDIVTVVMRVPDNFAPFVTPETEAVFETPSLPGVKIHGKVTRFPPSLSNPEHDRTMIVEVDLWNGSKEEYDQKIKDDRFRSGLKKGMPGDPRKGMPILPEIRGVPGVKEIKGLPGTKDTTVAGRQLRLLPGMFGEMTLVLRKFENTYMLPSAVIITPGGFPYIYVVRDNKAHLQPVRVQVDDGKLVKVELLDNDGVVLGDLTGTEEIIVSNQGELAEGQLVKPTLVENWKTLDHNEKP